MEKKKPIVEMTTKEEFIQLFSWIKRNPHLLDEEFSPSGQVYGRRYLADSEQLLAKVETLESAAEKVGGWIVVQTGWPGQPVFLYFDAADLE